ncbi:VOC family protein [Acrocarpospora catenulata]|uniref:VOC family protein n=1 Tax=Acrocarpospora catenulata TaxID=2836182 RepID=UPI001BD9913E|nr:VOC family protein [Acrocarpospora catenulata]
MTSVSQAARPLVSVRGLDHIVLHVADPLRSLDWYTAKLGMRPLRVAEFRTGKAPFPSVEVTPGVIIDLDPRGKRTGENLAHFCIEVDTIDLKELAGSGAFGKVAGPFRRWGARGEADLVYITDPDGNVIELRHYGPSQVNDYGPNRAVRPE